MYVTGNHNIRHNHGSCSDEVIPSPDYIRRPVVSESDSDFIQYHKSSLPNTATISSRSTTSPDSFVMQGHQMPSDSMYAYTSCGEFTPPPPPPCVRSEKQLRSEVFQSSKGNRQLGKGNSNSSVSPGRHGKITTASERQHVTPVANCDKVLQPLVENFEGRSSSISRGLSPDLDVAMPSSSCAESFYKTRYCKFYNKGLCWKGTSCQFAHFRNELRCAPDLTKTRICVANKWGLCHLSSQECSFAHNLSELRATNHFFKTDLCAFWAAGHCRAGQSCRHAHGSQELRSRATPLSSTSVTSTTSDQETCQASKEVSALTTERLSSLDDQCNTTPENLDLPNTTSPLDSNPPYPWDSSDDGNVDGSESNPRDSSSDHEKLNDLDHLKKASLWLPIGESHLAKQARATNTTFLSSSPPRQPLTQPLLFPFNNGSPTASAFSGIVATGVPISNFNAWGIGIPVTNTNMISGEHEDTHNLHHPAYYHRLSRGNSSPSLADRNCEQGEIMPGCAKNSVGCSNMTSRDSCMTKGVVVDEFRLISDDMMLSFESAGMMSPGGPKCQTTRNTSLEYPEATMTFIMAKNHRMASAPGIVS